MRTIVLLSGGIDSSACAHFLAHEGGNDVHPLFVDYGQKAAHAERTAAHALSEVLGLTSHTFAVSNNQSFGKGEIRGRNAFLIFCAVMSALYVEPCQIALGIHAGTPYYDCTDGFVNLVDQLIAEQSDGKARVVAPFVWWNKKKVFDYFVQSKLPLELTYSCESGTSPPCGICLSCGDRKKLG